MKINIILLILMISINNVCAFTEINPLQFGAVGDGKADDSESVQNAFTKCSENGYLCTIPVDKTFLVKSPLFIWGGASLQGQGGSILFNVKESDSLYLLNVGINKKADNIKDFTNLKPEFTGTISGVNFKVIGGLKGLMGSTGRIIYFWRTNNAKIINNNFDVGDHSYSATSSGNNNNWVVNGDKNCIRKNILISGNHINARDNNEGSEGIGVQGFDGVIIKNNDISGVGDDPIASHWSNNVKIINNKTSSVDGRIFVVNSKNVEIANNFISRTSSPLDDLYYAGVALIYVGFEERILAASNSFPAPTNISIHDNILYYPDGAKDTNSAILLYSLRESTVENNTITNDSLNSTLHGISLLPFKLDGGLNNYKWTDPEGLDFNNVGKVYGVKILNNNNSGKHPLDISLSADNSDFNLYVTDYSKNYYVTIENNKASNYDQFDKYSSKIVAQNNMISR